ncbi:MAG: hypothetical protein QG554_697, partial [Pseudomonadota bacterium]|nr:hypothetical protein [Pseudomonadota bacterium]
MILSLLRRSL